MCDRSSRLSVSELQKQNHPYYCSLHLSCCVFFVKAEHKPSCVPNAPGFFRLTIPLSQARHTQSESKDQKSLTRRSVLVNRYRPQGNHHLLLHLHAPDRRLPRPGLRRHHPCFWRLPLLRRGAERLHLCALHLSAHQRFRRLSVV